MSTTELPAEPVVSLVLPATSDAAIALDRPVALPRLAPVARDVLLAGLVAGVLGALLLWFGPPGVDRAAHLYHTREFAEHGWRIWDNYWYAGRYELVNYSILYYPLAALVGEAVVVCTSVVGTAAVFAVLAHGTGARRPRAAIVAFAAIWPTVLVAGQYPFALGAFCAVSALALWGRRPLAGLAAALCALLASPLAFLLLAVVLAGVAVSRRHSLRRPAVRVAAAGVLLIGLGEVLILRLFPSGGTFPYPTLDLVGIGLFCATGVVLARRSRRLPWLAPVFIAYLVAGVASHAYPSGVGGNIARLIEYFALPILLLLLGDVGFRPRVLAIAAIMVATIWQAVPFARDLHGGLEVRADSAAFWAGGVAWLQKHNDPNYRVEVVGTWGHWESYYMAARDIPLTRGWFRQDDFPVNEPLYNGDLDAQRFKAWLRSLGVRYVVLPNEQLDYSSRREAEILRSNPSGLQLVHEDGNVQIFELKDATPLLTSPPGLRSEVPGMRAEVLTLDRESISMMLPAPGTYDLRVRYTPYWTPSDADRACVQPVGPDGMTQIVAYQPGFVRLRFNVTLGSSARQALGGAGRTCAALPQGVPQGLIEP